MLNSFFNSIFLPLITWSSKFSLIIICLILTLVTTLAYKYLTDQKMLKKHKEEIKEMQKEISSLKDNPKKMMEKQKELMEKNMKIMMHSFKPMLITLIPLIIIFSWLNATFVYEPLNPNIEFPVTLTFDNNANNELVSINSETLDIEDNEQTIKESKATFYIKGDTGEHELTVNYNDQEYQKNILITNKWKPQQLEIIEDSNFKKIEIGKRFKPFFGLSWIWIYIIFSIIFSMTLRKILSIY